MVARAELQSKLETVAPALADNDIVPGYTHFYFTGDSILANNERIAITVPLSDAGFEGLLPPILLSHVKTNPLAAEAKITPNGNGALMKIGNTEIKMHVQPADHYRFKMPNKPRASEGKLDNDCGLYSAIQDCMPSISSYATVPDQLGITMLQDGRDLRLFATNRSTISASSVRMNIGLRDRVILSTPFCEQMLRLNKLAPADNQRQLVIRNDHVLFAVGDILLFGKLVNPSNTPLDFVAVVKRHLPRNFPNCMAEMDEEGEQRARLKVALNYAASVTSVIGSETKTKIVASNNLLKFIAISERGEILDKMKVAKHPDVEINVNARLLVEGYDRYEKFLLTERCAIMSKGNSVYLVAAFDD